MSTAVAVPRALVLASVAVAAACAIAFGRPGDIAVWPDSVSYFAAAESLPDGALINAQNQPLTVFPPGYPALVAVPLAIGLERLMAAFLVNLISVAVMAVVLCRSAWSRTRSPWATLAIVVACLAIGAVPGRLRYAGSELPFMALTMLALDWTDRRVWRLGALRAFALGLVCCAAFLTRYSGLVVIGVAGLWILGDLWRERRGYAAAVWFALGALPLSAGWLLRNYTMDGSLIGSRSSSVASVAETFTGIASAIVGWAMPRIWWANSPAEWLVVGAPVAAALCLAVFIAYRHGPETSRTVLLHVFFSVVYVAFVTFSTFRAALDSINERLLAPAFVPAVLALGIAAWAALSSSALRSVRRPVLTFLSVSALVLLAALSVVQARRRPEPTINYMTSEWEASPTTKAAIGLDRSVPCFSNASLPLYLWTGLRCSRGLTKSYRTADRRVDPLLMYLQQDGHTAYYIWYERYDRGGLIGDPPALLDKYVRRRTPMPDGVVFELGSPASH